MAQRSTGVSHPRAELFREEGGFHGVVEVVGHIDDEEEGQEDQDRHPGFERPEEREGYQRPDERTSEVNRPAADPVG